jgi:glycosyltransferase involved in cell wall biosynthesis
MEKACIATDVTGCKEIIEDGKTGLLCRVRDTSDLAAKMKQMIALPESALMEMGKQARQKIIREFDKKTVLNCYLKEIENISSKSEINSVNLSMLIHLSSMPSLAKSNAV